jgi:hypothetical protein
MQATAERAIPKASKYGLEWVSREQNHGINHRKQQKLMLHVVCCEKYENSSRGMSWYLNAASSVGTHHGRKPLADATDDEISVIARFAGDHAANTLLMAGFPIYYVENGQNICEYPDGHRYAYHLDASGEMILDEEVYSSEMASSYEISKK